MSLYGSASVSFVAQCPFVFFCDKSLVSSIINALFASRRIAEMMSPKAATQCAVSAKKRRRMKGQNNKHCNDCVTWPPTLLLSRFVDRVARLHDPSRPLSSLPRRLLCLSPRQLRLLLIGRNHSQESREVALRMMHCVPIRSRDKHMAPIPGSQV